MVHALTDLMARATGRYRRNSARIFAQRLVRMRNTRPLISFSFDDFPRSALITGGDVLEQFGATGTFYASMGLMGTIAPTGEIFHLEDLERLTERNHELGCHTFEHCHAWNTPPKDFEASLVKNTQAIRTVLPEAQIKTLSYPIASPRPDTKRRAAKYFRGCRSGGQTYNSQACDLNNLHGFFLEQSRGNLGAIKKLITANCRDCGWLIFATHDVAEHPTPYGCTPSFFYDVVHYSVNSEAMILPVAQALELVDADPK